MSRGLLITLIIIGVIVVFVIGFVSWGTGVYDKAVAAQEQVNAQFADVQATYQRRADLVPNLVATVKGAAENEREILTQVTPESLARGRPKNWNWLEERLIRQSTLLLKLIRKFALPKTSRICRRNWKVQKTGSM
jgi:hypothetical protein